MLCVENWCNEVESRLVTPPEARSWRVAFEDVVLETIKADFPGLANDLPSRWGFVGQDAEESTVIMYMVKRVPIKYRAKGAFLSFG